MKTQVIRLETHDDAISIRDKIAWGQTGRILLVWPDKGRLVLRYALDLTVLLRFCSHQGAQMALVTADAAVIEAARDLGIPVFKTPRAAQLVHWRGGRTRRVRINHSERQARVAATGVAATLAWRSDQQAAARRARRWIDHPAARLAIFGLAVLSLLAMAVMIAPAARIDVTAQTRLQTVTLAASASAKVEAASLSGVVPARPVTVIVEDQAVITPSGTILTPASQAEGTVRFTNRTDRAITIPAGMIVMTAGDPVGSLRTATTTIRYQTTMTGEVAPTPGSTINLPVRALDPGAASNVPARSLTVIEGALGFDLESINLTPIRNGRDVAAQAPTEADRQQLYDQLEASLRREALTQLRATVAVSDVLLEQAPTLARTLEIRYTPAAAQPAGLLSLSLRLEYQIQVVTGQDLAKLAGLVLDAGLPEGYLPLEETASFDLLSTPAVGADGVVRWRMRAERQLRAQVPMAEAAALAQGETPGQAVQRLAAALPVAGAPVVILNPPWWPRLPWIPFRIEVVVH